MNTLFSSPGSLLAVMFGMVALALYLQKYNAVKTLGPALTVIILGIILSNLKIVPVDDPVYGWISKYAVPVSMVIMLMTVDIKSMLKLSKEPLLAIGIAVFSVSLMAFIFGLVFAGKIDEGWKVAGMFVGTYTGGSSNLTAIATGLDVSKNTLAAANAADYVIGIPTLIGLFALPAILKKSKKFNEFWPYSFNNDELSKDDGTELMGSKEWSIKDIAWMLGLGFIVTEIATIIAGYFPQGLQSAARILMVTTIGIIVAQNKHVKKLRGNLDLGLYVALLFLSTIGFAVDLSQFVGSAFYITIFCFCVVIGCLLLHLGITRLFKLKYEYVVLSIVGAIADGSTAALIASSAQWKSLVSIAIVMGALGGVMGNYVGIAVAYAIKGTLGL